MSSGEKSHNYLQELLVDVSLVKTDVNTVSGGHHVVIVDNLIN